MIANCRNAAAGDWQGGDATIHDARFSTIAAMLQKRGVDLSVLDLGCGLATLREWLPERAKYVGVDPSRAAVDCALRRNPDARLVRARAEDFHPGEERFDSVVFNEMLYYCDDPIALIQRSAHFLAPHGLMLFSIYQKPGPDTLKSYLSNLLDSRRPRSNLHCEKMVRANLARMRWPTVEDRDVGIPGTGADSWHIWLVEPRHRSLAGAPVST